jgi:hypothetical protein
MKVNASTLDEMANQDSSTYEHELQGDELATWYLDDTVLQPSETQKSPPEPVDFAKGIRNAIAGFGFRSQDSRLFFVVVLAGITTVTAAAGLKIQTSGRTKNVLITSAAILVTLFATIIQLLDTWMFVVSGVLGLFSVAGGPNLAQNTFRDARTAASGTLGPLLEDTPFADPVATPDADTVGEGSLDADTETARLTFGRPDTQIATPDGDAGSAAPTGLFENTTSTGGGNE